VACGPRAGVLEWPICGLPDEIHLDNAKEFHSCALRRGAQEYGIELSYCPLRQPHYGGHIERLIGTTMGAVHLLPGTTFSNVQEKGSYDSVKQATMTMAELERWLALEILGRYHQSVHSALHIPPLAAWEKGMRARGTLRQVQHAKHFFCEFLPGGRSLIRRDGIRLFNIHYWSNVLTPPFRVFSSTGPCPTTRSKPQSSSPTRPGARSTHSDPLYFAGNARCDTVLPSVIPSDHLIASKYIVRMSGSVHASLVCPSVE
jgi:hypothetical protein